MKISFNTENRVCASFIDVETDDDSRVIKKVVFHGGCPGSHLGIAALAEGMKVEDAIKRLSGIRCGGRQTSCPDQLAEALKRML